MQEAIMVLREGGRVWGEGRVWREVGRVGVGRGLSWWVASEASLA